MPSTSSGASFGGHFGRVYAQKSPCWLVAFVALRPKSTAMVIAGRSVHLTTLYLGRLEQAVNQ